MALFFSEHLNGKMTAVQHLKVFSVDGYYATNNNITFNASVTDIFNNATVIYMWGIDTSNVSLITNASSINVSWEDCGSHFVEVTVIASIIPYLLTEKVIKRTTAYLQYFHIQGE